MLFCYYSSWLPVPSLYQLGEAILGCGFKKEGNKKERKKEKEGREERKKERKEENENTLFTSQPCTHNLHSGN